MKKWNWQFLQLFAEGDSGDGSATGETPAAAGQDRAPAQPPETQAAAAPSPAGRMTWEQVKSDPEYSGYMQAMVQDRIKNIKQAQSDLQTLQPALEVLAKQYGLEGERPDYGALAEAIRTAPEKQEAFLRQHHASVSEQGRAMEAKYPGFRLEKELEDPLFSKLVGPGLGVSLEDAYFTVHRREIQGAALQVAAERTACQISNAIRAGGRPVENGTSAHGPSVSGFDYRSASREQREALKMRIRLAGARGEKIYPGL